MASVVVSTSQVLLHVDLTTHQSRIIDLLRTEYYGISWFEGSSELVLSHSGLDNAELLDIQQYANSEVGYVSMGRTQSERFLSAPHQLLCLPDGRVLCTNTGRNAVTAVDLSQPGYRYEVRLSDARWDRESAERPRGDHLNSVFMSSGGIWVLAHGFAAGSRIARLTYPHLEVVEVLPVPGRSGLHNLWATDEGQLISCDSDNGALIDTIADVELWKATSSQRVYTRGLAASREYVVVGESSQASRSARNSSLSGLWIIDRSTWQALDYIALGPVGPVHEVRLLDVPDLAHHGTVFAGAEELASRDTLAELSLRRMTQESEVHWTKDAWRDARVEYGTPVPQARGRLAAPANDLVLMTQIKKGRSKKVESFSIKYSLEDDEISGHVGLVTYRGAGTDCDMHAFIIRRRADGTGLISLWTQDGTAWTADAERTRVGVPLEGTLELERGAFEVIIRINGEEVLNVKKASLPYSDGKLGVRWLGTTVTRGHQVL